MDSIAQLQRRFWDVLLPQLDDHTSATYAFRRALQGPVLEMQLRGILSIRLDARCH